MSGWLGALLGCALAGVYLLWLSRFWEQQLVDGRPWTTAGMLIPGARRLGCIAAFACFGLAVTAALSRGMPTDAGAWRPALTGLLCLLLSAMLVRAAAQAETAAAALAACLAGVAAVVAARQALTATAGVAPSVIVLIVIVGLALVVLAAAKAVGGRPRATFTAFGGGVLPVLTLLELMFGESVAGGLAAAGLAALALMFTLVFRVRAGDTRRGAGYRLADAGLAGDRSKR
jgi:hypothetical protein